MLQDKSRVRSNSPIRVGELAGTIKTSDNYLLDKFLGIMLHNNIEANYSNLLQDVVQEVEK